MFTENHFVIYFLAEIGSVHFHAHLTNHFHQPIMNSNTCIHTYILYIHIKHACLVVLPLHKQWEETTEEREGLGNECI